MSAPARTPERAHAAPDQRLRTIIDRMADGIVIVDEGGLVRFANPAAAELFGRSAHELEGGEFGVPLTVGETTEIDVVRRGGGIAVAELRVAAFEWEGEDALLVSLRDVTARKEADAARRRAEAEETARREAEGAERRARFLSEVSAALASSFDYHGTLERLARLAVPELADWCTIDVREEDGTLRRVAHAHADPAKTPLLEELRDHFPPGPERSFPAAEALESGRAVFHPDCDDAILARLTRTPEHTGIYRALGTCSLIAVPLVARAETLGAATFARGEAPYTETDLGVAEDFAQRAAQSVSNARLYQGAQAASRAKSEFLAVMSHELRTPLNAITGYTDLLEAGVAGEVSDGQHEYLERIKAGARHLVEIVEEILTFSRMEAGAETPEAARVDLREVVRAAAGEMRPVAARKGLGLRVRLPDEPAMVVSDPARVAQVLRNLLSNAVKFTEDGMVSVEGTRDHTHHLVRVRDTGIGIPAEHLQHIFEPFWQVEQSARREAGGTGLGLAVARGLAEMLGGHITVDSAPGEGSTFTLAIPAAD